MLGIIFNLGDVMMVLWSYVFRKYKLKYLHENDIISGNFLKMIWLEEVEGYREERLAMDWLIPEAG